MLLVIAAESGKDVARKLLIRFDVSKYTTKKREYKDWMVRYLKISYHPNIQPEIVTDALDSLHPYKTIML